MTGGGNSASSAGALLRTGAPNTRRFFPPE